MRNGRGWGQDVTVCPHRNHVGRAAVRAATNPRTWIPLAGAAVFGLTGWDHDVSRWAADRTPVYGSPGGAVSASNDLLQASEILWIASVAAAPSGHRLQDALPAKAKGAAVDLLAVSATKNLTVVLKKATDRTRPNGKVQGFPSAHTSSSAVYTSLALRNVDGQRISGTLRNAADVGLLGLTAATAWARVEARAHYPSDVLFGAALGTFLAEFLTEALTADAGTGQHADVRVLPEPGGTGFEVCVRF
jgi:membrane-associated phospholipid phosphatase